MAPVTRTVAAAATLLAAALPAAPASGGEPGDPISGLVAGILAPPAPPPTAEEPATTTTTGSVTAPSGPLRRGCRNYPYRYSLATPTDEWTLEVNLRDRDGRSLSSGTFISDADASSGKARFRFCRWSTRPGWFTIRALVHWYEPSGAGHAERLPASRFRLWRPR